MENSSKIPIKSRHKVIYFINQKNKINKNRWIMIYSV